MRDRRDARELTEPREDSKSPPAAIFMGDEDGHPTWWLSEMMGHGQERELYCRPLLL